MDLVKAVIHAAVKQDLEGLRKLFLDNPELDLNTRSPFAATERSTPLIIASAVGDADMIDYLLAQGADVNIQGKQGSTALAMAVEWRHPEIIERLLQAGADVNVAMDDGTSPLMKTASYNLPELASRLLEQGANVNANRHDGWTSLMLAAHAGSEEMLALLLEHGATVNQTESNGRTPLMAACFKGHIRVVEMLLSHGAQTEVQDADGATAMSEAAARRHQAIVALLQASGAPIEELKPSSLDLAKAEERRHYATLSKDAQEEFNILLKWLTAKAKTWARKVDPSQLDAVDDDSAENIWLYYLADKLYEKVAALDDVTQQELTAYARALHAVDHGDGMLSSYLKTVFMDMLKALAAPQQHACLYL
ncbi:ankyrin repeat domain-containing protein [Hahella aquimaris]|uniref:ankyrin repeat domain-containing protein n=1 Tax=Hahella sp. HNIBRBA332 TaxID=3015983 RepID=UPI00273B115B|nr:ankyrin repeat domain-containing protein [Hahella sp. HNIBRBA332]WLQ13631.1 ankyrin repeat domain-containing protein [Hahella sp. HNIBRBA332]